MYEHMVLFKFAADPTPEQLDKLEKLAHGLKEHISGIVDLAIGRNVSERNQGFQVGLTVRFTDKESLDAYGPHPKHQELVAYTVEIGRTDIIVVDFAH